MTDRTQEARKALQDNVTALKARSYRLDTRDDLILLTKMNRALLDVLTQTPNALDDKVTAYQKDIAARLGKRMTDAPAITPEIYRTTRTAAEGIVDKVNSAKDRNQAVDYITALILHAESLQQSHDVPSIERKKALPAEVKAALNGVSKRNIYSALVKQFEAAGFTNTAMFLVDPSTLPTASTPAIIIDPETKTSYPELKAAKTDKHLTAEIDAAIAEGEKLQLESLLRGLRNTENPSVRYQSALTLRRELFL